MHSPAVHGAGLALIIAAAVASGVLALEKLDAISLPGCGPGSACDAAQSSRWGTVPGLNLPASFVGLGYFAGLAAAWLVAGRDSAGRLRPAIRAGAAVSVFYLAVIVAAGHFCKYCIATHVFNLALWLLVEKLPARPGAPFPARAAITGILIYAAAQFGLKYEQRRQQVAETARQETALTISQQRIIDETHRAGGTVTPLPADPPSTAPSTPGAAAGTPDPVTVGARPWGSVFAGRYPHGPNPAAIRIVLYTDYQCPDCYRVEQDVIAIAQSRTDVSISVKHFPMCADCNGHVARTMHANACWAARAAEAAGILGGPEAFWRMHQLLFARRGGFTDGELHQLLRENGYDPQQFIQVMMGPETLANVQRDIEEAVALGLHFTPMVFINGVELRGVFAPNALRRAVEALAATNPPPAGPESDDPPLASTKYVEDWRKQPARSIPPTDEAFARGPAAAPIQIVVFGDYQESNTAQLDALIQSAMRGRQDVRYAFRVYPFDQSCNPNVKSTMFPASCAAARVAKAAGALGGGEAFWKMHRWLLEHAQSFNDADLSAAAAAAGVEIDALRREVDGGKAASLVELDVTQARNGGLIPQGVPTLYVNGRWVPRWTRPDDDVLGKILREAGAAAAAP